MCKLITHLCKFLKIEDLNLLQRQLRDQLLRVNQAQTLVDVKLCKKIKYYMIGYINEIINNSVNYKQEVQLYNEALNQFNLIKVNLSNKLDNSYEDLIDLLSNLFKRSGKNEFNSAENEQEDKEIYYLFNNFNINQDLIESENETNIQPEANTGTKYNFRQTYD